MTTISLSAAAAIASIAVALLTGVLAVATWRLATVARAELDELRAQHRGAEAQRQEARRRETAMELLKRVVQGDAALRDLVRDMEGDTKVNAQISAGMMLLPHRAWPRFEERWAAIAPELATFAYVADFVTDNLRTTLRGRIDALDVAGRSDDRHQVAEVAELAENLMATLDEVRGAIDDALGLPKTRRPL